MKNMDPQQQDPGGSGRGYKVSLVIPAGRQRYLELLIPNILKQDGWDELKIWINTTNPQDLNYIERLPNLDKRISLCRPPLYPPNGNRTIGQFFKDCISPDTVYIRFDDDICFIEPGLIKKLAKFRADDPEPFLVSPIVINNAIISYIFQVLGKLSFPKLLTANCLDDTAWKNPAFAEQLHRLFLAVLAENNLGHFKFSSRPIAINRFSINCISWLGSEFQKFEGIVPYGADEEEFLSVTKPTQLGRFNYIFGEGVVSHFSFFTQREHLDQTDILAMYKDLLQKQNSAPH
jgi:hypothetical protein